MGLLDRVNNPKELKVLSKEELPVLASEIRERILEVISKNGGHLGAALGVVELTIALHYVFNSPKDAIIWDVGHQAHAHKILTERRDAFSSIRQYGGLSGFLNQDESPHDIFSTGHAGASISTALGLAAGRRILPKNGSKRVIAVIGDASLVNGMAFEALNHAGHLREDLIVVLNDNEMSISRTVGAISNYLNKIISNPFYNHLRKDFEVILKKIPRVGNRVAAKAKKIDEGLKNLFIPGLLFEELGFKYFGPIDGHNIEALLKILTNLSKVEGPILLHVLTKKGKGYSIAEDDPARWHASTPFCLETGEAKAAHAHTTYTQLFGRTLERMAEHNPKVVAVTAAMCEGTGLVEFSKKFPDRFFDVGIAEEHAVSFAAGLAKSGLRPVVAIYSAFLQRSYDQVIHDVAFQRLPVIFCIDRAGLVGEDGPTHHGSFDLGYLSGIPGMTVLSPRDGDEFSRMMAFALSHTEGPVAIRYPRDIIAEEKDPDLGRSVPAPIDAGKPEVLRHGNDLVIFAIGSMVYPALKAAEMLSKEHALDASVVNTRFVKPLDEETIGILAEGKKLILTVEEGILKGGLGNAISQILLEDLSGNEKIIIKQMGLPDYFIEHGRREILLEKTNLTANGIVQEVLGTGIFSKGPQGAKKTVSRRSKHESA